MAAIVASEPVVVPDSLWPGQNAAEQDGNLAPAAAGAAGTGGAAVDAGGAAVEPPPGPQEPVTPADPCAVDELQVHVGRNLLDLGEVPAGGTFSGDPQLDGNTNFRIEPFEMVNPDPTRDPVRATAYVPEGSAKRPLVFVSHGFSLEHSSYESYSRHFATHDFAVVGLTFPHATFVDPAAHDKSAAELTALIDFVVTGNSPHGSSVDETKIAAAGHSFGGKISFYAASLDERIDIVIGWDPSNSGGAPCFVDPLGCVAFPVAPNCGSQEAGGSMPEGLLHLFHGESIVFGADPDALTNPDPNSNARHFFRGAPAPATYVDFGPVGHAAWVPPGDAEAIRLTRATHLAVLLARFKGMDGLEAWLPGGVNMSSSTKVVRVLTK